MRPAPALVSLPARRVSPARELGRRVAVALGLLVVIVCLVWLDRGAYTDTSDGRVSLIDAIYYATVTITTTGYGDITPVAPHARILNALLVTPMRIAFLVLLVGTTLEVLASEGRRLIRDSRWRKQMRNHIIVIGYGTKGRSAIQTLRDSGVEASRLVVIDDSAACVAEANLAGYAAIQGDATRREILHRAETPRARQVIITLDRDDTAILVTLTVRQLNPGTHLVVAVREGENVPLLRQSGASSVITSSDAVGRLLGLSAVSPNLGTVIEDLLSANEGLEIAERQVARDDAGLNPSDLPGERVLGVVRNKTLRRFYDPAVAALEVGDQLVVVRKAVPKVASKAADKENSERASKPGRRDRTEQD